VKLLATKLEGADPKQLRETVDQIKAKLGESVVVLGGRPDFAQAGGDAAQLDVAVASVQAWVEERLN